MITTYAIMTVIATVLLVGYCALLRNRNSWLLLLYICVTIVNVGYLLLALSKNLEFAIFANDIVYLGSVFLSMSMLLTIVRLCGFEIKKKLVIGLTIAGAIMFAMVATAGILPWYYKEVSLVFVDGAAKLEKEYGILHPVYLLYLLTYFAAMVACIIRSIRKKVIASQRHAALLAVIVLGNIAVWLVEKFIPWNFEFLSVSYLFSEIILLGIYWMMQDYVRLDLVPKPQPSAADGAVLPIEEQVEKILSHLSPGETLSARERQILEMILENKKRKEIADLLCLSENTIKTYTRTLYSKTGVGSREELYSLLTK